MNNVLPIPQFIYQYNHIEMIEIDISIVFNIHSFT